jgi:hypothetical protein
MKLIRLFAFAFILSFSPILSAHHAMEYIEMESYSTAFKGEFVFHLHFDYMVDDQMNPSLDHWEFTPGLSYGITDRLMFDFHTHYAKFGKDHVADELNREIFSPNGPSPFMEAAAFSLQYRLTEGLPVNIALAIMYEVPFSRSKELLEGTRVFQGMLIVSHEFGLHSNMTVNLSAGSDGGESYYNWAFGIKTPLSGNSHGIAGGLEFLGDFEGGMSVLAGVYFPLGSENIIFKTGLEFSSGSSRANTTLMTRF